MISVLMCVYNENRHFLELAITSVLKQSYGNFEFIIVDDGSDSKDTLNLLNFFARNDDRIKLIRKKNSGLTKSLNYGLLHCQGDLIFRQDSDDWSEPRRFELQIDFLNNNPEIVLLGTFAFCHQENGRTLWVSYLPTSHNIIKEKFNNTSPFYHGSICIKRNVLDEIGYYNENLICSQDYDLFWRISEKFCTANLSEPLYHYRYCSKSVMAQKTKEKIIVIRQIKYFADIRRLNNSHNCKYKPNFNSNITNYELLHAKLTTIDRNLLAGRFFYALKEYLKIILIHPFSVISWKKLLRCIIFIFIPRMRSHLFNSGVSKKNNSIKC